MTSEYRTGVSGEITGGTAEKKRPRVAGRIKKEIERLSHEGYSAPQIHEELVRTYQDLSGTVTPPKIPHVKTIRAHMPDLGESWPLRDAPADVAPALAEVLAALLVETGGRRTSLTREEAEWIAPLARLAPDLPSWTLYRVAGEYVSRQRNKAPTTDLDAFIALAPWRSGTNLDRWQGALDNLPGDQLSLAWWLMHSATLPDQVWERYSAQNRLWPNLSEQERALFAFITAIQHGFDERQQRRDETAASAEAEGDGA